ncbi:hypothetical protein PSACC_01801 [Paramicrosporidium saccamoebae]|uniref:CN hydrolase domain-containing protein n=1 Tax=Paramicrosporidium saccamoebae TaxID=1246581 RepID=A0A2H9TKZ0_9FUNG|nr:hypothetical protein PSACC_01801 [Paramicrosporidium saccamoebae]
MLHRKMKVSIIQMLVGEDKSLNVKRAMARIREAATAGAKLVILPVLRNYAEQVPEGDTCVQLAAAAKSNNVWLIGGTIPECADGKVYNCSTVYSPSGFLFKYQKVLFSSTLTDESDTLSAGTRFQHFDCESFRIGVGICYDLRFPEFSSILASRGCNLMVFPSAFNTTTGPLHWHLLQRARAVDQACYVISASPARDPTASYKAYGHSMVVSPMGEVLAEAGEGEEILYAEINPLQAEETRRNIPALRQKRTDGARLAMTGLVQRTLPTCFRLLLARADRFRKRSYHDEEHREDPIRTMEQTIFNLGNPHPTLTIEEDVAQTATMVVGEMQDMVPAVVACILELPHKLVYYVRLLKLIGKEKPDFVSEVVKTVAAQFPSFAAAGPWRHFVQSVRFYATCVAEGVLGMDCFVEFGKALLACTGGKATDFVLWTLCAALPLAPVTELDGLLATVCAQRGDNVPKDLTGVWHCMKNASRPEPHSSDNTLSVPLGSVTAVTADDSWDAAFEPLMLFPDAFQCGDYEQWTVYLWCRILLESMELNHRRCADLLLNGIPASYGTSEKIVVQFLFGELLRNRSNKVPALVYETLLMDCCRLSRTFPPNMAKGLFMLYDQLEELGFVATDRLASWFSHHLSNFDYKWKWAAWSAVLTAPPTSMQYVFVRFTLKKLVRLSYYDRVAPTVPEEFKVMLPENVCPHFKFADSDDDAAEMAGRITEQIQSRGSIEEIKRSLGAADDDELDAVQREVLLQSLLQVGSKSLSHMLTVVEKYLSLFQLLLPKHGDKMSANMFILDQLYSFWRSSMLHFEFAVERLINYRILLPKHVIQWIFERADEQLCDVEASFYEVVAHIMGRGIIMRTIQQSSMMSSIAAAKMSGQPEERIATTVSNLQAEYEETLALAVEKLATLREQLVASDEMLSAVHKFTCALIKEIVTCYQADCVKISGGVLAAVGRKMSNEIRVILEEFAIAKMNFASIGILIILAFLASTSGRRHGKKQTVKFSSSTSSYSSTEEDNALSRLREDVIKTLTTYVSSLHSSLRTKNRALARILISRRMGETAMHEAIREWALGSVNAAKSRAKEAGGELKTAVQTRWGMKGVGRRNAFASTAHNHRAEEDRTNPLRAGRPHGNDHEFTFPL